MKSKSLNLSFRQRKLLYLMQSEQGLVTGEELAKQLEVSSRTIRSDVATINGALKPYHAEIYSERSKGYTFIAKDSALINELNHIDNAFLSKDDRMNRLALRLFLAGEPLNTYDLEDEFFVSHTTLEHDIAGIQERFTGRPPHLKITYSRDWLSVEDDEEKIRCVLVDMIHGEWNYHAHGSNYYGHHFIDEGLLAFIMKEMPVLLDKYHTALEDPELVALNLSIAVMCQRVASGHLLPETETTPDSAAGPGTTPLPDIPQAAPETCSPEDTAALALTEELLSRLEQNFGYTFPASEKHALYRKLKSHLFNTFENVLEKHFQKTPSALEAKAQVMANEFVERIRAIYNIDFSLDKDFLVTLIHFVRDIAAQKRYYAYDKNFTFMHEQLLVEFEISWVFNEISERHLGHTLTKDEIICLSHIVSGAIIYLCETHPEKKIRAVVCCHLNPPAYWSLKRQLLSAYGTYISLTNLLPVNAQHFFDFSGTDLVFTTVNKNNVPDGSCDILKINSILTDKDHALISDYISKKQIELLSPKPLHTVQELLRNAFYHCAAEDEGNFGGDTEGSGNTKNGSPLTPAAISASPAADPQTIIRLLYADFVNARIVPPHGMEKLLKKEAVMPSATRDGILFLPLPFKAEKTRLSVAILDEPCRWDSFKVRTVIMGAFTWEDTTLVFRLIRLFHDSLFCAPEDMLSITTQEELILHLGSSHYL